MPKTNKHKPRSPNHPSVKLFMKAIDHLLDPANLHGDEHFSCCFEHLFGGFNFDGWHDDGVRAAMLALVINAPVSELPHLEQWARDQIAFVNEFGIEQRYFKSTGKDLHANFPALRAALAGKVLDRAVAAESELA